MKRITFLMIILFIIASFLFLKPQITGNIIENYSYTEAICNENNYCEDYYIECSGNNLKKITPTGFSIQYNDKWSDKRVHDKNYCE